MRLLATLALAGLLATAAAAPAQAPAPDPGPATAGPSSTHQGTAPRKAPGPLAASHAHDYRFIMRDDRGRPAHWACAPVTVGVNTAGLPAHALADVKHAAALISAASGYRITVRTTRVRPTRTGDHPRPGRSGAGVVLVAAAHPGVYGFTDPWALATASSAPIWHGDQLVYERSVVLVNTRLPLPAGPGQGGLTAILEHEFGHVLGLDHVRSGSQIMNPYGATRLGAGDIAGLRALHRASCR